MRRKERTRGRDRGAIIVEAALVLPLLVLMAMGVVDLGFLIDHNLTVASATTTGARAGARAADADSADYQIIQAVESAQAELPAGSIQQIIVFKADRPDGKVPSACLSGTSTTHACNVYDSADLGVAAASFVTENGWIPSSRKSGAFGNADFVGVHVRTLHTYQMGVFGETRIVADTVVNRIDPEGGISPDVSVPPPPPVTTSTTTTTTTAPPTTLPPPTTTTAPPPTTLPPPTTTTTIGGGPPPPTTTTTAPPPPPPTTTTTPPPPPPTTTTTWPTPSTVINPY